MWAKKYATIKKTSTWPSTAGVIEQDRLKNEINIQDVYWNSNTAYSYTVNEKSCFGYQIFPFPYSHSIPFTKSRFFHKYKQGKKVEVFYNPANPEESCLETGSTLSMNLVFIIKLIIFSYVIVFFMPKYFSK